MQKVYIRTVGRSASLEFKPDVPLQKAPGIEKEYTHHGIRMYKTKDGKTFNADAYDRNFNAPKGKVLPRGTKGPMGGASW